MNDADGIASLIRHQHWEECGLIKEEGRYRRVFD